MHEVLKSDELYAGMDDTVFAELYDQYFPRIHKYVHYRVYDSHDADDLVSYIFLKAFSRRHAYDESIAPFWTWLLTIARNVVTDYCRQKRRMVTVPWEAGLHAQDVCLQPVDIACHNETVNKVHVAIKDLSQRERDAIALKYWGGHSNREVAKRMGIGESNAGVILFRAMQRLRCALEKEGVVSRHE